jgi:hypothetical protein
VGYYGKTTGEDDVKERERERERGDGQTGWRR